MTATGNTNHTVTRTAEQSHLVALAERDDLAARLEATEARLAEAERLLRHAMPSDPAPKDIERWYADRRAFLNGGDR